MIGGWRKKGRKEREKKKNAFSWRIFELSSPGSSVIIIGLLKDIILWQISLPYLFLGLNMDHLLPATRLEAGPSWVSPRKPKAAHAQEKEGGRPQPLHIVMLAEGLRAGLQRVRQAVTQDRQGRSSALTRALSTVTPVPRWRPRLLRWLRQGQETQVCGPPHC